MGLSHALAVVLILLLMTRSATWKPSETVARDVAAKWGDLVRKYSQFNPTVPPRWILAMICVESAGDPNAIGADADRLQFASYGLMQVRLPALKDVNKAFGKNYTESDLKTPHVSIEAGYGYMTLRMRKWNDLAKATMAYNGGDGNVGSALTRQYFDRVKAYDELLKTLKVA